MQNSIRLTSARKAILDLLQSTHKHLTAQEVHKQLKDRLPSLNLSTVYRSLEYLVDHQLISVSDMGVGSPVYATLGDQPHHHLVCQNCHQIFDLDSGFVDDLFSKIEDRYQAKVVTNHLVLFVICENCRSKNRRN
jgi:Fur family ferric uptake transcriptional regulator